MTGVAALLGGLGAVFLGFGLVQLVIWMFQPITHPGWLWAHMGLGAALLLVAVGMSLDSLRERMRSGEGQRATRYGTSALLSAVLGIGILAGLAFLAERHVAASRPAAAVVADGGCQQHTLLFIGVRPLQVPAGRPASCLWN